MKVLPISALLVLLLCFPKLGNSSEHRPPSDEQTITIDLPLNTKKQVTIPFEYQTENVTLTGKISRTPGSPILRIEGDYLSYQNLEAGINLAFQIYDSKNNLLFKEGGRTPFSQEANCSIARFNYQIDLAPIDIQPKTDTVVIQFNYVKEFEYWADLKFPDIELPSLKINSIEQKSPIKVSFSWIPHLIPVKTPTFTFHRFSVSPNLPSASSYRPSIEAYSLNDRKRIENPRYNVTPDRLGKSEFLSAEMIFEKTGRTNRRLGFVLEGVRWHKRPPNSYQSSWVLPYWLYSSIAFAALAILSFLFHLASISRNKVLRSLFWTAAIILSGVFLLEFATSLLPAYLSLYAAAIVVVKCKRPPYATYWIIVSFIVTQELIWTSLQAEHDIFIHGLLFSLFLAPLIAAPLVLIKKRWLALAIGNALLVAIPAYYLTANLYYAFFEDYPTWNVLTYASQGLDIADSISSLLDERYSIAAISLLFYFTILNTPLLQSEKTP